MQPSEIDTWWTRARPDFQELLPEIVAQIDNEAARLKRLLARSDETVLCFLGQSGIGKSTLLNAIVADAKTVLPAGGTGPLTAIATLVRFSERPFFRARYQRAAKLRGILLNLERELGRQGIAVNEDGIEGADQQWLLEDAGPDESDETGNSATTAAGGAPSARMDTLIRATQTLVKGTNTTPVDLPGLVAGLRCALGLRYNGQIDEGDRQRLADIGAALKFAQTDSTRVVTDNGKDDTFASALHKHAAGALAPLVAEIEVGWPSPALRGGVVLVDLPGVGIAGDDYQRATHAFIRQRARGVIMVVRRGVTNEEIELIRSSGFWERALLAAGDPEADPCDLMVAVTMVDSLVESRLEGREPDDAELARVYGNVMSELKDKIRDQTVTELGRLSHTETDDDDLLQSRKHAAKQVLDRLTVHPVSAFDYRRLISRNPRFPALASDPEETGLPALARWVEELGKTNMAALRDLRESSAGHIVDIASAAIDQELAGLAEGRREREEFDRLRGELARFLEPVRLEYAVRQGQFREFLDSTSSVLIDNLVERAQADARKRVVRYLGELSTASWATLKAAVVRGGAFHGSRKIDLADDIAQLFQEPVAAIWGSKKGLLRDVRARTSVFGDDTRVMIGEVLDWASAKHGHIVSPEGMEARRRAADTLAEQLGRVGRDAVDDLRQTVRDRLLDVTKPAIGAACQRFVAKGDAAGRGVKQRMIVLFADLAEDSMGQAAGVARQLLNERFAEVRRDISDVFDKWGDPLDRTAEAIAPPEYTGNTARRLERIARLEQLRLTEATAAPPESNLS